MGFANANAGNDSSGEIGIVLIIQCREKEKTVVSALFVFLTLRRIITCLLQKLSI